MLSPEAQQEAMSHLKLAFKNDITSAEEGALLFSPERFSGQLLLVFSGSIRLIDPSQTMGSLTLAKLNAPLAFGISQLLDVSCNEEVRALSTCTYALIDTKTIKKEMLEIIKTLILEEISLPECALMVTWLENAQITTKGDYRDIHDFRNLVKISR